MPEDRSDAPGAHPSHDRDPGYLPLELELIAVNDDSDRLVVLPKSEDMLRSDAFLVVESDALCSLEEHC